MNGCAARSLSNFAVDTRFLGRLGKRRQNWVSLGAVIASMAHMATVNTATTTTAVVNTAVGTAVHISSIAVALVRTTSA